MGAGAGPRIDVDHPGRPVITTPGPRPGRRQLTGARAAAAAGGFTLALIAVCVVLTVVTGDPKVSANGATLALSLTFLAVGLVVARRQPANPVGWLLVGTGLATAFTTAAGLYTELGHQAGPGSVLFGRAVLFAENATWPVPIIVGMSALVLFPDGRLTAPWRRALWAYGIVSILVVISQGIPAVALARLPDLHFNASGQLAARPDGLHDPALALLASGLPVLALVPFWLAWIGRQVASYRRATGDRRQQLKWFSAGAAVAVLALVIMTLAESAPNPSPTARAVSSVATFAVVALPLGMGLGILRYRLYDIDRIISRTVGYALVTGLLIGVYAGLVVLATQVLGVSSPVSVAASTLAAVALFNPVRRRVQRAVDRQFNRARYDADRTIDAFAARLKDAVDTDAVRADLLRVMHGALEPAHVSVWTPQDGPSWPRSS
jgi:hypothetical protein